MNKVTIIIFSLLIATDVLALANPASVNCAKLGGELKIEQMPQGDVGICYFQDGKQCEEWALFRGQCPVGGVNVSGVSKEERNCLIRGGDYNLNKTSCTMPKK